MDRNREAAQAAAVWAADAIRNGNGSIAGIGNGQRVAEFEWRLTERLAAELELASGGPLFIAHEGGCWPPNTEPSLSDNRFLAWLAASCGLRKSEFSWQIPGAQIEVSTDGVFISQSVGDRRPVWEPARPELAPLNGTTVPSALDELFSPDRQQSL